MCSFIKKLFTLDKPSKSNYQPLKYREYQYSLSELERRLNAEVQGYGTRY
jgi:hypothetical protein